MSYTPSGRSFSFFGFASSHCDLLWHYDGRICESALFSFRIILFFNKQILIMLHSTTEFFAFFPKSNSKISNILKSARGFPKSAQVLRNQCLWEYWSATKLNNTSCILYTIKHRVCPALSTHFELLYTNMYLPYRSVSWRCVVLNT